MSDTAKDICDYLFRVGRHQDASVEFYPVGYVKERIDAAIEVEREECAKIAEAHDDPGQTNMAVSHVCERIAGAIRAKGKA